MGAPSVEPDAEDAICRHDEREREREREGESLFSITTTT